MTTAGILTVKQMLFQGYHDVAVTLLLVVGEDLATALLEQISVHQLRYFSSKLMVNSEQLHCGGKIILGEIPLMK